LRGNELSNVPSDTPPAPGEQAQVSAVAIGDRIVAAFRETTDKIRLRIVGSGDEISSGTAQRSPALATDGASLAVVWMDNRASDCTPVVMASAAGKSLILSTDVWPDTLPAIVWDGSEFVAVWERANDHALMAIRIAADGTAIDTAPQLIVAGQEPQPFVSFSNASARLIAVDGELILVWGAYRSVYIPLYPYPTPGTFEVKAIRLSRSLMPLVSPRVISKHGITPAAATDGKNLLVVWRDDSNAIATRLSPMLEPLGESVIIANVGSSTVPSVAWKDDHYFVAVGNDVELVSREGRPLGATAHLDAATESIVVADTVIYAKGGVLLARPLSAALPPPTA